MSSLPAAVCEQCGHPLDSRIHMEGGDGIHDPPAILADAVESPEGIEGDADVAPPAPSGFVISVIPESPKTKKEK